MQYRLYTILILFLASFGIITNAAISEPKIINVNDTQLTKEARTQVDCLADNIYFEAGFEPNDGKVAVALVTLNRVNDPRYPKDICGVVKQKAKIETIGDTRIACQFSWYCDSGKRITNTEAYKEARKIALYVYANYENIKDFTNGALFYHADYVNPRWRNLTKTAVIGRHIFYKEKAGI